MVKLVLGGARDAGDNDARGPDADFRFCPGDDQLNQRGDAEMHCLNKHKLMPPPSLTIKWRCVL